MTAARLIESFTQHFPRLFAQGIQLLEQQALAGDRGAAARLEDARAAYGVLFVGFDADHRVRILIDAGKAFASSDTGEPREGETVVAAVEVPADAAEIFWYELQEKELLDHPELSLAATRLVSKRAQGFLRGRPLRFHVIVRDTPDFEELRIKIALQQPDAPQEPDFCVEVRWNDLVQNERLHPDPSSLFTSGKVRFSGDYAPALSLAMEWMQRTQTE